MTHTLDHGVTSHTGSAVSKVEKKFTEQLSKVPGMVSGRTETIFAFPHTLENTGSVTGKGTITIALGLGEASVTGISGGLTHIGEISITETLGTEQEWSFSFTHMPHAA